MKILFLTVGGTHQPIITSIKTHKPDMIYFVCSEKSQKVVDGDLGPEKCQESKALLKTPVVSIAKQLNLEKGSYSKIIIENENLDSPNKIFKILHKEFQKIYSEDITFIFDYTGGTKSMSASLFQLSFQYKNIELAIVSGQRTNLIKTDDKTEMAVRINSSIILLQKKMEVIQKFIEKYYYSAAAEYLRTLVSEITITDERILKGLNENLNIIEGFDKWDRFDYSTSIIKLTGTRYAEYIPILKKLTGEIKGCGYELVFDLINNSKRAVVKGLYDDGASRLYRVLELFIQIYLLREYNINTSIVDINRIASQKHEKYEILKNPDGIIQLGLFKSYELLEDLQDKVIYSIFKNYKSKIRDVIQIRNNSKLAHGNNPISETNYNKMYTVIHQFLIDCFKLIEVDKNYKNFVEFPNKIEFNI